jgi:predicted TIM-barrel fold metal-dependent hydrolase
MRDIIDSHVHMYSPEVANDPVGWAARHSELHWAEMVSATVNRASLQGWADAPTLLAAMEASGVVQAVMLGWYWENQETCEQQNRWYADWAAQHPGELRWFATIHPGAGQRALDEVRRAAAAGASGLGELSPAGQGFSLRDPSFLRIAQLAVELGLPINFHVNEALGRSRPGRMFDDLTDFQWLAAEFPELIIILAHWGGMIPFFELNRTVRRDLKNVFYDTAASPLLYDPRIYRLVVDAVGPEKILFGSDYPLLLYPRREREPGFSRLVDEILSAGLTDPELNLILRGNARRLLGLRKPGNLPRR